MRKKKPRKGLLFTGQFDGVLGASIIGGANWAGINTTLIGYF